MRVLTSPNNHHQVTNHRAAAASIEPAQDHEPGLCTGDKVSIGLAAGSLIVTAASLAAIVTPALKDPLTQALGGTGRALAIGAGLGLGGVLFLSSVANVSLTHPTGGFDD